MKYLPESYWERFQKKSSDLSYIYDGLEFEKLIGELLKILYGCEWNQTKKSHDNNRDFWIMLDDERIWAECKNYRNTIAMDVLAPTLVMAQIYEANKIIFFSRSEINPKAKDKILAYGEKTGKQIIFYDAKILENLIIEYADCLSSKYQPTEFLNSNKLLTNCISTYFFQDAITSTVISDEEFLNYDYIKKIRYNEAFAILLIIQNPFINQAATIKISFSEENPDRFKFEYLEKNICFEKKEWQTVALLPGEGKSLTLYLRPIIYNSRLKLPQFDINIRSNSGDELKHTLISKEVKCSWIGQSKLIGNQYENILIQTEEQLIDNVRFSCLLLTGSSGTGKSRMLLECINIFLKYNYKILRLTMPENYSSGYLLKEIIYFLYDVPKSLVLSVIEEKIQSSISDTESTIHNSSIHAVLTIIRKINTLDNEDNLCDFIDEYGDILFEKLAAGKFIVVIDNIQFAGDAFLYFLEQYTSYATNQARVNRSVLAGVFNQDYMTASASNLLFHLHHSEMPNLLTYKLNGFVDEQQGILFLRELIHTQEEIFDDFFRQMTHTVSLKPYNLYQMVQLLEEENIIKISPDKQGYLFVNNKAWEALSKIPDNFLAILNRRWDFLRKNIKENILIRIFSALYLFDIIDEDIIDMFRFEQCTLDYLCEKHFLKKDSENRYMFDHDIIRKYFETKNRKHLLYCLSWLNKNTNCDFLSRYPLQQAMYYFAVLNDSFHIAHICKKINNLQIPKRLCVIFYQELLNSCLNSVDAFESANEWIRALQNLCTNIRKHNGSINASYFYKKIYNVIVQKYYNFNQLYSYDFRQLIHSYCDILVELHDRDGAEKLIADVINRTEDDYIGTQEQQDERYVLRAIMYNRWYVAYNNAEPTEKVKNDRTRYMRESRKIITYIHNKHKQALIKYLNDSDEGYNYYGYQRDRDILFEIWDNCIQNIPHTAPEKTMNYYRKLVQYDLINKNYEATYFHINQGREYLENGKYSHEPLIFNTFFLMAEVMVNLQRSPKENHYYTNKLINDILQIQSLLKNGKMGDILLLKGVDAYYSENKKDTYYSFKNAYEEYAQKSTSRFWIKKELLIENIRRSFSELKIYENGYDVSFLPEEYRIPLTKAQLSTVSASGIQQTTDGKMNLPLI